ncbi:MAG: gamma-glutamyltransferase family protein [Hyphomicrobiales bacterium]
MFTTRPEITGTFGVAATTHWLGTAAAMAVLERGGNAFDAGVTAGFTLQVIEPHLNGPGGDLPAIAFSQRDEKTSVLCAQGPAPKAATIAHFEDLDLDTIPGSGLLPAVIPGAFDGWMNLLLTHGTWPLADVLEFAIHYAERGYPVLPRIAGTIEQVSELFRTEWKTSGSIYLDKGAVPQPGSFHRNPHLAQTYRKIIEEAEAATPNRDGQIEKAREIWAQGWVAHSIDRFFSSNEILDPSGRRHKGLLTGEDMAGWRSAFEDPVSVSYGDYEVFKAGFWSQGPVMLQQLRLLETMGLGDMALHGPEFVHTATEAIKLAFADREAWYGDPEFADIPAETLLSKDYANERRALIGDSASRDMRPGSPDGRTPNIEAALNASGDAGPLAALMGVGEPTVQKDGTSRGDTVHIDVIDRHGNMISATPSGGWLQSSPVIPELGFCLGNRAQMFWLDESSTSALVPGKRPRTTLSPSLAYKNGEPYMAFGTPGGDQQDQWSTLMFLYHVEHGLNLQEAIDAPSFHSEHFPSSFWPRGRVPGKLVLENRFSEETLADLVARGHKAEAGDPWSEGRLSAATKQGDILRAAANPRGMQGYAAGR